MGAQVKIGQILLTTSGDRGERFAALVESLARRNVEQHVLTASVTLARRLADCPGVTVGPVVRTPVMAYCLMPEVDVAHAHELRSAQAGLLLNLTRSIPFVITADGGGRESSNPLTRSIFRRASALIPRSDRVQMDEVAAEHLRIYIEARERWVRTALML